MHVPGALEKSVYSVAAVGGMFCRCVLGLADLARLKSSVLLILCLVVLPVIESEVLTSSAIIINVIFVSL